MTLPDQRCNATLTYQLDLTSDALLALLFTPEQAAAMREAGLTCWLVDFESLVGAP